VAERLTAIRQGVKNAAGGDAFRRPSRGSTMLRFRGFST
jgi:hypothetical protein